MEPATLDRYIALVTPMSATQDITPTVTFDWTEFDSPSTAVITAVATNSDEDPTTIEPLNDVLDPDSLNSFLAVQGSAQHAPNESVEFEYQGYWIVIKANGQGYLYDQAPLSPSTEGL